MSFAAFVRNRRGNGADAPADAQADPLEQGPALCNFEVELSARANCFMNRLYPKPGTILMGPGGIDFIAATGIGFASVPWQHVAAVRAELIGKHVHGLTVVTDEGIELPFIPSRGDDLLRCACAHAGRDKIVGTNGRVNLPISR